MRRSSLTSLVLLTLLAAGCAHAPLAITPAPGGLAAREDDGLPTTPGGRKLGYDLDRARKEAGAEPVQELPRQGLLPPAVDLRPYAPPVYDQGDLGACTGFAIAKGLRELQQRQRKERATPLSALFLYYEERVLSRSVKTDGGATIAEGMKVLQSKGCATEASWPYKPTFFSVQPNATAYKEAATWRVGKTYHLASLDSVKTSLARGYAVAMGFECYRSFDSIGKDGWMPMPKPDEKLDGGHAALVVGYSDKAKCLVVRNSYGANWGDKGYFYMPYAYASNKQRVDEYWAAW